MSRHIPENREEEFAYMFEDDVKELLRLAGKNDKESYQRQLKIMKTRMSTYDHLCLLPYEKKRKG